MKRKIIKIDEEKCTGCGLCVPECHEEAIKIIDGKAKLIKDAFCDGLGACLGECPEGALSIEEREAKSFDETLVKETIESRKKEEPCSHSSQSAPQNLHVMSSAGSCPDLLKPYLKENRSPPQTNFRQKQSPRNSHTGRFKCTL